jgi:hypothetical protein
VVSNELTQEQARTLFFSSDGRICQQLRHEADTLRTTVVDGVIRCAG